MGLCGAGFERISLLGFEGFVSAYQIFGWGAIKECYTSLAVTYESLNSTHWDLIMRLSEMVQSEGDLDVQRCTLDGQYVLTGPLAAGGAGVVSRLLGPLVRRIHQNRRHIAFPDAVSAVISHGVENVFSMELLNAHDTATVQELTQSIVAELKPVDDDLSYQEYEALKNLVDAVINTFDGTSVTQHISKVLFPFWSRLQKTLARRSPDFRSGTFRHFPSAVVIQFAENMTPKPPGFVPVEWLRAVGCVEECEACRDLREFVLDGRPTTEFKKRGNHIVKEAKSAGGIESLEFTLTTATDSRPHILTVTKPANMIVFASWYEKHTTGITGVAWGCRSATGDPRARL
ncbi:hypothetical protein C8R44DRAFT_922588 [Mycena epipterygia]|nr:hypothetical protein C8R44DRAFT_922588 [Mycena epipterygia]